VTVLAALVAALAAGLTGRPRPASRQRLTEALRPATAGSLDMAATPEIRRSPLRFALAAAVMIAAVVTIGGPVGLGAGLIGAGVVAVARPGRPVSQVNPDDVPVVADLVAGCLAAGASLADALDAAAIAGAEVMRDSCREVAGALRSGVPPDEAWRAWLADPWLAPIARTAVRTTQSGAAAAADLRRTSARLRTRRRAAAQHRVRQASVWLVVPLGLCFLPAFVLVAVVPLVIGLVPSLR
jgi:Flp pilus assembly protein TadB